MVSKRGSEKPVKSEPPPSAHTLLLFISREPTIPPSSLFPSRLWRHGFFHACNLSAGLFLFSPNRCVPSPLPPSLPLHSTRLTRIHTTDGACKRWAGVQRFIVTATRCRRIFLAEFLLSLSLLFFVQSIQYGTAALSSKRGNPFFSAIKH